MATFGRDNVCVLVKGEAETPNDTSGVVYVGIYSSGTWKPEVNKELKVASYKFWPLCLIHLKGLTISYTGFAPFDRSPVDWGVMGKNMVRRIKEVCRS